MYRHLFHVCVFVFISVLFVHRVYAFDLNEGEWQLRVQQSVPGMPAGIAGLQWRECLSSSHPVPTAYLQAGRCDVVKQHVVYHTLHYELSCFGEHGTFTNEGQIRFGRLRLTGRAKSDMGTVAGQRMLVRYTLEGRRVGTCE